MFINGAITYNLSIREGEKYNAFIIFLVVETQKGQFLKLFFLLAV